MRQELTWILVACATMSLAATQATYEPPFKSWVRLNEGRPILSPRGAGFEAAGTFNPAVIKAGRRYVMLYRAQDSKGISRLGYASSTDGVTFTRDAAPVLSPDADYERGGGVEDPRLVEIGGLYYLTYTAYNGKDAQLALATSPDLRRWQRKGVILPAYKGRWNVHWTKAGAILPQAVGGKYWMFFMADARGSARALRAPALRAHGAMEKDGPSAERCVRRRPRHRTRALAGVLRGRG